MLANSATPLSLKQQLTRSASGDSESSSAPLCLVLAVYRDNCVAHLRRVVGQWSGVSTAAGDGELDGGATLPSRAFGDSGVSQTLVSVDNTCAVAGRLGCRSCHRMVWYRPVDTVD